MKTMETIRLQGRKSSAGDLYLFATDEEGKRVEVQELIDLLFAWDRRSFLERLSKPLNRKVKSLCC